MPRLSFTLKYKKHGSGKQNGPLNAVGGHFCCSEPTDMFTEINIIINGFQCTSYKGRENTKSEAALILGNSKFQTIQRLSFGEQKQNLQTTCQIARISRFNAENREIRCCKGFFMFGHGICTNYGHKASGEP